MNKELRNTQLQVLKAFPKKAGSFALTGGTALELYYLHHRFSVDLDFFSSNYDSSEIDDLVKYLAKSLGVPVKLESELIVGEMAKARFYSVMAKGLDRPLKIDFVEDVFRKPDIVLIEGVPVYSGLSIYYQKIAAMAGTRFVEDEIGRTQIQGRNKARDAFDVYCLSQKIQPLSEFMKSLPRQMQIAMTRWYQSFSRQEMKLALLDLDIYDAQFDAGAMIHHLEAQMKQFMKGELSK